jgi:hypothetical protein
MVVDAGVRRQVIQVPGGVPAIKLSARHEHLDNETSWPFISK